MIELLNLGKMSFNNENIRELSHSSDVRTPAIVYSEAKLLSAMRIIGILEQRTGVHMLLPMKACSTVPVLQIASAHMSGFSSSSLFESKLARDILGLDKVIHLTSPGIREDEIQVIGDLCDQISFNSLSQFKRFHRAVAKKCELGLRINTEMSFVDDPRYDPCMVPSKLGVPISFIRKLLSSNERHLENIQGLLIHSNCESEDFGNLLTTVNHVALQIPSLLEQVSWINLGGGYLFDETTDWSPLEVAVKLLAEKYNLEVFFEPGKGIVGEAGHIIASVLDIFDSGGKKIAVLDTTVNHMPEVFEYQYRPTVTHESPSGPYRYILAGATCLAGDVFGEYVFDEPLAIGSKVMFEDMGAYTLVKAHMFNGINLPAVYLLKSDGEFKLVKTFDYEDFLARSGANYHDFVREKVVGPKEL